METNRQTFPHVARLESARHLLGRHTPAIHRLRLSDDADHVACREPAAEVVSVERRTDPGGHRLAFVARGEPEARCPGAAPRITSRSKSRRRCRSRSSTLASDFSTAGSCAAASGSACRRRSNFNCKRIVLYSPDSFSSSLASGRFSSRARTSPESTRVLRGNGPREAATDFDIDNAHSPWFEHHGDNARR